MPKNEAGYFLHLLESCDNLAFPTTLAHETGVQFRDILLRAPIEWVVEIKRWLTEVEKEIPLQIIEERYLIDD
jgi:hypothetical protein